ncbi:hypothetical protein N0V85_008792, partial [Neurospora sp. IMI 360204]
LRCSAATAHFRSFSDQTHRLWLRRRRLRTPSYDHQPRTCRHCRRIDRKRPSRWWRFGCYCCPCRAAL